MFFKDVKDKCLILIDGEVVKLDLVAGEFDLY